MGRWAAAPWSSPLSKIWGRKRLTRERQPWGGRVKGPPREVAEEFAGSSTAAAPTGRTVGGPSAHARMLAKHSTRNRRLLSRGWPQSGARDFKFFRPWNVPASGQWRPASLPRSARWGASCRTARSRNDQVALDVPSVPGRRGGELAMRECAAAGAAARPKRAWCGGPRLQPTCHGPGRSLSPHHLPRPTSRVAREGGAWPHRMPGPPSGSRHSGPRPGRSIDPAYTADQVGFPAVFRETAWTR